MDIGNAYDRAKRLFLLDIWAKKLSGLRGGARYLYLSARTLALAVHDFMMDSCGLRAASLTLVFVFSLAPALAVGFAVAKGFGAQERIKPVIYRQVGVVDLNGNPTQGGEEIRNLLDKIWAYIDKTDVSTLGIVGLLVMIYAAYKVLSAVEGTMNHIWSVRRQRTIVRKIVDYMAVLSVSPIMLILTALVNAAIQNERIVGTAPALAIGLGVAVSVILACAALAFLYFFFPNTRVPPLSALIGALVAALLLQGLQILYLKLQIGVQKYNHIYGSFAALPIFLMWLYLSWLVVLLGAEISYAHANQADWEYGGLTFRPSPAYLERLSLGVMAVVGRAFVNGDPPPTCRTLSQTLAAPMRVMRNLIGRLATTRLLAELQSDEPAYQPGAPLEKITLGRIMNAVNGDGDESAQTMRALEDLGVTRLVRRHEEVDSRFHRRTLEDFVNSCDEYAKTERDVPAVKG